MLPLVLPKERLEGSEGSISHDVTAPPVFVGVTVVIARSFDTSTREG